MEETEIALGYIQMSSYTSRSRLFPDWMYKDKGYVEETKLDPNEIIFTPKKNFTLEIRYPLTTTFKAKISTGPKGMTRRSFVNLVVKYYKLIYKMEDEGIGGKTMNIPGMFNSATSNGRWGIWGHCLGDLILHTACIRHGIKGLVVEIECDS